MMRVTKPLNLIKELELRGARMGTSGDFAIIYDTFTGYRAELFPLGWCGYVVGAITIEDRTDAESLCKLLDSNKIDTSELEEAFLDLLIKKKQEGEE